MVFNQMQGAIQMPVHLLMHRNPVGPRVRERRNVFARILNHQVAIERQLGGSAQRLHHRRPQRDIRDKMPVHHIHVDNRGPAISGNLHLVR